MKRFLYRPQRGSLADSMALAVETDIAELDKLLRSEYGKGKVLVEHYCYDDRIGWDTYIVTHDGKAVGFTNGSAE